MVIVSVTGRLARFRFLESLFSFRQRTFFKNWRFLLTSDTDDPVSRYVDAFQELIQRVIREADDHNWTTLIVRLEILEVVCLAIPFQSSLKRHRRNILSSELSVPLRLVP